MAKPMEPTRIRRGSGENVLLDTLGLGFCLWLAGYLASFALFFILPKDVLGWVLFAVFAPLTVLVAYWRFHRRALPFGYFIKIAAAWTLIAIVFDYLFIVLLLNAAGYYKLDVLVYYATTFLIPIAVGVRYAKKASN